MMNLDRLEGENLLFKRFRCESEQIQK